MTDGENDSPFAPPYRNDVYHELPLVHLHPKAKALLQGNIHTLHQQQLLTLLADLSWCPEPLPFLLHPDCPLSDDEIIKNERIHALLQLLTQLRDQQHQRLLRLIYKTFRSDHRQAARELYAHELFPAAFIHYHALYLSLPPNPHPHHTIDLLEKLAITCLRANWPSDAQHFASLALAHDRTSLRARIWLATAQLALGNLHAARKNLRMLPKKGEFPADAEFPRWVEGRVQAQRAVLARLEREKDGMYDVDVLRRDPCDAVPAGPHFITLAPSVTCDPAAYRTRGPVRKGDLLMVLHPLASAPCYAPPSPSPLPHTIHTTDPPLLTHTLLADGLYTAARTLPHIRDEIMRLANPSKPVLDMVGNRLRAGVMWLALAGSVAVPGEGAHGGHAVYLPLMYLRAEGAEGNTYATFVGPHLFLHASKDLNQDTPLVFDAFDANDNDNDSARRHGDRDARRSMSMSAAAGAQIQRQLGDGNGRSTGMGMGMGMDAKEAKQSPPLGEGAGKASGSDTETETGDLGIGLGMLALL